MIQTFIRRAGGRQFAVLTAAAVALSISGVASAVPMVDLRSEAISMGIDPDLTPTVAPGSFRRGIAKASGNVLWDNGNFDNSNGLAAELNTQVPEARTADDFETSCDLTAVNFVTAQLYKTPTLPNNGRLEVYTDAGGLPGTLLNVYNTTAGTPVGTGFGYTIFEYDWNTAGLQLPRGIFWIAPMQVDAGTGRGFFAFSRQPHSRLANAAFKSTFFGFPNWVDARALGFDFDAAFKIWGDGLVGCGGGTTTTGTTTTGGDCDLTAIEAKLDEEERFTDDDELNALRDELVGLITGFASQASVDALEVKADAIQGSFDRLQNTMCDIIRLLHTPNGLREADCNGQHYEWNGDSTGGGGS
jgi:hypothetical protein